MPRISSIACLLLLSISALAQEQIAPPAAQSAPAVDKTHAAEKLPAAHATSKLPQEAAPEVPKPLPDIPQLLLDVERNEKQAEAIQNTYTYHVHRVEQEANKDGGIKKTTVTDADSFSIDGVRVNRTTAINGKPLTPDEARKEAERIDKEVAKERERRAKEQSQGRDTNARGQDILSAARILELGKFSNPRREVLNGRSTIVVDYAGDPQAKTHSTFESAVRDLVGTAWIDEQDRALVRAEGHFVNDLKVGAGLVADLHKGSNFSYLATRVNGETWLPASIEGRGSMRVILFFSFNGAFSVTTSDYRKFRSSAQIVEGTETKVPLDGEPATPASTPATEQPKP